MNNAINEIKNTLEATNSRITEAEDRISELEDRMVEINESERKKENRIEMRTISETSRTILNATTFESQGSQKRAQQINRGTGMPGLVGEQYQTQAARASEFLE